MITYLEYHLFYILHFLIQQMDKERIAEVESSPKVTPPELKEFSELLEREAYRKQLVRKNGSLEKLEKVNTSFWNPKFELEDFVIQPKEEQLPRVRSEPLMKEGVYMLVEEKERLMRGTKRVRGATPSTSVVAEERRSENISGRGFDLDLNKVVEDSFSSN